MPESQHFDAAIVGGGPSGLSAALTLARAGRRIILFDAGEPRNAPAAHSHGFLTRDGAPPEELQRLGRGEVEGYGGTVRMMTVDAAERIGDYYHLTASDGSSVTARALILATGVVDVLPEIPGLDAAWGRSAVHCPYCDGYEHRSVPTAILGRGDRTFTEARLLRGWTDDLTVVTNGPEDLSDEQAQTLEEEGTRVVRERIERLNVHEGQIESIAFVDGSELPCRALYVQPPQRQRSPLAERLGVPIEEKGCYETDRDGRTEVPSLFVIGDASDGPQSIAVAVAEGQWAGMAANYDLVVGRPDA